MLADRRRVAPFGLSGGAPGAVGRNYLVRADGRREDFSAIKASWSGRATASSSRRPAAAVTAKHDEFQDGPSLALRGNCCSSRILPSRARLLLCRGCGRRARRDLGDARSSRRARRRRRPEDAANVAALQQAYRVIRREFEVIVDVLTRQRQCVEGAISGGTIDVDLGSFRRDVAGVG